jgi:serine/threonine-protein kinase
VQELAPWVSPEIAAIVHRALRFDPAERFQSAGEMLEAVKALLPNGWALHKDMLAPLSDEDRAVVADKLEVAEQTSPVRASLVNATSSPGTSSPDLGTPPPSVAPPPPSSLRPEPPRSEAAPPSKGVPMAWIGLGLAAAALASVVVYKTVATGPAAPAPAASAPAASASAAAAPSAAPSATAAPTAAPPQDRTVKLVLVPGDVSAEVDGAPAKSKDGVIEVTGPLGSVHKVKLTKGKRETTGDVVVTEAGAMPPKLELEASSHKASPSGTTAPAKGTTIDKKFE